MRNDPSPVTRSRGKVHTVLDDDRAANQNLATLLERLTDVCVSLRTALPVANGPSIAEGRSAAGGGVDPKRVCQEYLDRGIRLTAFDAHAMQDMVRESVKFRAEKQCVLHRETAENAVLARRTVGKIPHPHGFEQGFAHGMGVAPAAQTKHPSVVPRQDDGTIPKAQGQPMEEDHPSPNLAGDRG